LRILAIECSSRQAALALCRFDSGSPTATTLSERILDSGVSTSGALLPTLQELLDAAEWEPGQLQRVAVTNGPGSFTGLRIGVTAAKFLAWACHADLVPIGSLAFLAACATDQARRSVPAKQTLPGERKWLALIDAQRNQVFAQPYHQPANDNQHDWPAPDDDVQILDRSQVVKTIDSQAATLVCDQRLADRLVADGLPVSRVQVVIGQPQILARLAWDRPAVAPLELTVDYCRPSAAEEKRRNHST